MPQLAADVPGQIKFVPEQQGEREAATTAADRAGCFRSACRDCGGRLRSPVADARRFSSPGLLRPHLHLPLCGGWQDLDVMAESSPWLAFSNFDMPRFLNGARLRRSKR